MKSSRFCPAKSAIAMPLVLSIDKNEKRKLTAGKTTIHVFCTGMALVICAIFFQKYPRGRTRYGHRRYGSSGRVTAKLRETAQIKNSVCAVLVNTAIWCQITRLLGAYPIRLGHHR